MFEQVKKLRGVLYKKLKEPKYTIRLTPEVWEQMPKLTKKQIAELMAQNEHLKRKYEEETRKRKELEGKLKPKEVRVLEKVLAQKKQIKTERKTRRTKFIFPKSIIAKSWDQKFFRGQKGLYKFLYALEGEESKNGLSHILTFLFKRDIKNKKDKYVLPVTPEPAMTLHDFLSVPYILSSLNSGHITLPVYIDGMNALAGEIPPIRMANGGKPEVNEEIIQKEEPKITKNVPTVTEEVIRKEIAKLKKRNEESDSEKLRAQKMVEALEIQNKRLQGELTTARHRADIMTGLSLSESRNMRYVMNDFAKIAHDSGSVELNSRMKEGTFLTAMGKQKEHIKELVSLMKFGPNEMARKQARKEIEDNLGLQWEQILSLLKLLRVAPEEVKGKEAAT